MKTWTSEQLIRSLPLRGGGGGSSLGHLSVASVASCGGDWGSAPKGRGSLISFVSFLGAEIVEPKVTYRTPAISLGAPQVRTSVPA